MAKKKDVSDAACVSFTPNETAETLPKIRGAVCVQWRIYKGKRLGPYYFRFWREDGKLRKQYIKPADIDAIMAACEAYRHDKHLRRLQCRIAWRLIREYTQLLREVEHGQ